MTTTTCNSCGKDFAVLQNDILIVREGEYEVSYFVCPHCKEKYQVFTSDEKMRELIKKRIALQERIKLARIKRFSERKIRTYFKEWETVKKKQEEMLVGLKKIGDDILKNLTKEGDENGEF